MFVASGGGNLSTDSPVRRQKRFQSALRKFQRFTDGCTQESWASLALWKRDVVLTTGTFLEHVCPAVGCPSRHPRWPDPGCGRRSISERRSWLLPLSCAAAQGCWLLPRKPGYHRQEMQHYNPNWHAASSSRQHRDWCAGTSG